MTHRLSLTLAGALPALLLGAAHAEPTPASATVASASPAAPTAPEISAAAAEEAPASRYPRDVISRPLTYPAGVGATGFDLTSMTHALADPATARLLVGYGITDDVEVNFGHYMFPTNALGKGTVDFGAGVKLVRGAVDGKLEIIGRVQSGYSLATSGLNPLLAGVHVQYNLTPTIGLITPGGQLSIGLDGASKPVTFGLPLSLGWQASPTLYIQADSVVATLAITNASSALLFRDATPLAVTAYLNAMPQVDVFAGVSANLTPADTMDAAGSPVHSRLADTFGVLVGARYYLGKL